GGPRGRPAPGAAVNAPPLVPNAEPSEAASIAEFVRRASFEATRPSDAELDALTAVAAPGTRIYISALASRPAAEQVPLAVRLRDRGFEPGPPLGARHFVGHDARHDPLHPLTRGSP